MTPEGKVLAAIVKELKRRNVFYRKLRGSVCQQSGMPDTVLIDRGRTIWVEVKKAGGKPTRIQEIEIQKIRAAGGEAYCVDSVEALITILERRTDDGV